MGTVVVTGANGMLGKTVCDKFKSQGVEVIDTFICEACLKALTKFSILSSLSIDKGSEGEIGFVLERYVYITVLVLVCLELL